MSSQDPGESGSMTDGSQSPAFETPDHSAAPTPIIAELGSMQQQTVSPSLLTTSISPGNQVNYLVSPSGVFPPPTGSRASANVSSKIPLVVTGKKKRHFGSVTDLTPEGILTEDASSGEEDGDENEIEVKRKTEAFTVTAAGSGTDERVTVTIDADGVDQESREGAEQQLVIKKDDLVKVILEELGTSPAPAAHTLVAHSLVTDLIPVGLPMRRSISSGVRLRYPRTKIICAIGPACQSQKLLGELLDAGMNVARLNFSHGDHEYHATSVRNLRAAIEERQARGIHCRCAILLDTKGPEIRTGKLENGLPITLEPGQLIEFSAEDYAVPGNDRIIKCSYEHLAADVKVGSKILVADGELSLEVLISKPERNSVICRVQNHFVLGERKNVSLPGVAVRLPGITDRDRHDITNFALVHNVDIISGSFTRTAAHVRALRECLNGAKIRVHAKIESVEALQHLDEIVAEADGVHVSRGDLGMELPLSKLPLVQKAIIHACNVAGKPVVTSTQLLQSMVENPRPTNAECTDVANAVLDGSDCVMLSAETANGKYPIKAVQTMARILVQAERLVNWEHTYDDTRAETLQAKGFVPLMEAICSTAVETAIELRSKLIVVASDSGRMGLYVAKYRPRARILVVTESERVANQMNVSRGVEAIVVPSIRNLDLVWEAVCATILTKDKYRLPEEHPVVLVDSPPASYDTKQELLLSKNEGIARWNMVRVMRVPRLDA